MALIPRHIRIIIEADAEGIELAENVPSMKNPWSWIVGFEAIPEASTSNELFKTNTSIRNQGKASLNGRSLYLQEQGVSKVAECDVPQPISLGWFIIKFYLYHNMQISIYCGILATT